MRKNPYLPTAISIYLFFVVYGMAVIIMSQHSDQLQAQWGATEGQVLVAISGIGIGKIIGPSFAGLLSDRIGRRWMLVTSFAMYVLFLLGMIVSPSYQVGFALAVFFGLANAISDTGAYPTLMESFPKTPGSANLIVKAAIAVGQLLIPIIVTAIAAASIAWGSTFIGLAVILAILLVVNLRLPFPDYKAIAAEQKAKIVANAGTSEQSGARIGLEGTALVLYGFTSTAIFWLASQSLPKLGVNLVGMSPEAGKALVSFFSIGSFAGVFITAALVARKFKPVTFLVLNPTVATFAYIGMLVFPNAGAYRFFAFIIGYFAAGGLFQLTVVVLAEFFPVRKGVVTSLIGLASGLAAFALPYSSGLVVGDATEPAELASAYQVIAGIGIGVSVASAILGVLVLIRHRIVFPRNPAAPQAVTASSSVS
ncbi:MAG: MFS transporter [Actinobacteria bacterium]|nr:MFS transporter [Actinomycetota bacterium]MCG2800341.1 MFS transporter [Cellulomonas sp.]